MVDMRVRGGSTFSIQGFREKESVPTVFEFPLGLSLLPLLSLLSP